MKPDILVLLKTIAQVYRMQQPGSGSMCFIMDMLLLAQPQKCPLLLSGEDDQLLVNFKEFLVNFLRTVRASLQGLFRSVLVCMIT